MGLAESRKLTAKRAETDGDLEEEKTEMGILTIGDTAGEESG